MGNILGMVVLTYKGKGGLQGDHAFEASYILRPCLKNTQKKREVGVGSRLMQVVTVLTQPYLVCSKVQKNQQ